MADVAQTAAAHRGQFLAQVVANRPLCRDHYLLTLQLAWFPPTHPGQFVQVACDGVSGEASAVEVDWPEGSLPRLSGQEIRKAVPLIRRPFSLAGRRDTARGVELDIIHRVVGIGTAWLAQRSCGDEVNLLGPLGNHFVPPPDGGIAVLVGGGVGIPPMIYLASRLAGTRAVVFSGATTRDLLPLTLTADAPVPTSASVEPLYNVDEFARHGIPAVISTDDGSYGFGGLITDALALYLDRYFADAPARQRVTIYTCGPEAMMKRVVEMAGQRGMESQVSVERAMACGMGTCQSCCIRVRKPDAAQPPLAGSDWCYRLACTDGPVFRGADLLW